MGKLYDLSTFTHMLTTKGYDGYFHTEDANPGRLKESMEAYLEKCREGEEPEPKGQLSLTSYLQWEGEDKAHIRCRMVLKHQDANFDVRKLEITKIDRYGQQIKHSELTNLSAGSVPKIAEAIAMMDDVTEKHSASPKNRRFKL